MLIGVTGGIGGGKSCVARKLAQILAAELFSADDTCRELLELGQPGYQKIISLWGERFLGEHRTINRAKLRKATFADKSIRQQLEAILHPLVRLRLEEANISIGRSGFIIAEVPLLYECGWQGDFDWIVCVYTPADLAAARVAARDGTSLEEARAIIAVQLVPEVKRERADSVIDNGAELSETEKQVKDLATFLRQRFPLDLQDK